MRRYVWAYSININIYIYAYSRNMYAFPVQGRGKCKTQRQHVVCSSVSGAYICLRGTRGGTQIRQGVCGGLRGEDGAPFYNSLALLFENPSPCLQDP